MPLTGHTVIYGGSFNPPHFGHQVACTWLIEALNADEVIIVPTYKHAFGKELLSFGQRVEMCKLMTENLWPKSNKVPGKSRVWVSEVEKDLPHPNITLNTVNHFMAIGNNVAVAIGSDLVKNLDEWTGWSEVMNLAKIVILGRGSDINFDHGYDVYEYFVELSSISSSQVRSNVRKHNSITGLVPASIKQYITDNSLYR